MLDVDGGDVVGEQEDLVAEDLASVLQGKLVVRHQLLVLDEVNHERAGSGEWVEDVHARVGERLAEFPVHEAVGGVEDVVDDLVRGVYDAHLLGRRLERLAEELLVELLDDLLPAPVGSHALGAQAHA